MTSTKNILNRRSNTNEKIIHYVYDVLVIRAFSSMWNDASSEDKGRSQTGEGEQSDWPEKLRLLLLV